MASQEESVISAENHARERRGRAAPSCWPSPSDPMWSQSLDLHRSAVFEPIDDRPGGGDRRRRWRSGRRCESARADAAQQRAERTGGQEAGPARSRSQRDGTTPRCSRTANSIRASSTVVSRRHSAGSGDRRVERIRHRRRTTGASAELHASRSATVRPRPSYAIAQLNREKAEIDLHRAPSRRIRVEVRTRGAQPSSPASSGSRRRARTSSCSRRSSTPSRRSSTTA